MLHWPPDITETDWFRVSIAFAGAVVVWQIIKIGTAISSLRTELSGMHNALKNIERLIDMLDTRIHDALLDIKERRLLEQIGDNEEYPSSGFKMTLPITAKID